jgi:hypothetical protein
MESATNTDDPTDFIDQVEAKRIVRPPSEAVWQRWHRLRVIPHYVPAGTRQRRYSRRELLAWIRSGAKAVQP